MSIVHQFMKRRTFPAAFPARVLWSQQAQAQRCRFLPAPLQSKYHRDEGASFVTRQAATTAQAKATSFALWAAVSEVKKDLKDLLDAYYDIKTKEDMTACMEKTVDGAVDRVVEKAGVKILTKALASILDEGKRGAARL